MKTSDQVFADISSEMAVAMLLETQASKLESKEQARTLIETVRSAVEGAPVGGEPATDESYRSAA